MKNCTPASISFRTSRREGKSSQNPPASSPKLAEFRERLNSEWWHDTNVRRTRVLAHIKLFAELLQLSTVPTLQKRSKRTPLTLEDFRLA